MGHTSRIVTFVLLCCSLTTTLVGASSPVLNEENFPIKSTSRFGEVAADQNEKIRNRKAKRRKIRSRLAAPDQNITVKSYRRGNRAALVDQPLKPIDRAYEFEEMWIKHPDIFNISVLKEITIQERVESVYVSHSIPNTPRMWGRKLNKNVPPIVLLHGAHFSSATWDATNTITAFVEAGYHVFTVDLPGYGRSKGTVDQPMRQVFLRGLIKKLKLVKPFIVAPSMSGSYAVPLVHDHSDEVSGLVAVAATHLKQIDVPTWKELSQKLRILYVYGEKDEVIGAPGAKYFEAAPDIEIFKMKQGSHPCYVDKPKQFNEKVLKFLARATKTSQIKRENALAKKTTDDKESNEKLTEKAERKSNNKNK